MGQREHTGEGEVLKQRPTLAECLADYEQVKAKEFDPGQWMRVINKMRIWGYGVQAEPIVEELRKAKERFDR